MIAKSRRDHAEIPAKGDWPTRGILYPSGADGIERRLANSVSITNHSTSVLRKLATAS
jgi:hypothetical protein